MHERRVVLRDEVRGDDRRHLDARLDHQGRLRIDGRDRGPATSQAHPCAADDYQWFTTYAADDVGRVVALLGGAPGDDVLDLLERLVDGGAACGLEQALATADIPCERSVWFRSATPAGAGAPLFLDRSPSGGRTSRPTAPPTRRRRRPGGRPG